MMMNNNTLCISSLLLLLLLFIIINIITFSKAFQMIPATTTSPLDLLLLSSSSSSTTIIKKCVNSDDGYCWVRQRRRRRIWKEQRKFSSSSSSSSSIATLPIRRRRRTRRSSALFASSTTSATTTTTKSSETTTTTTTTESSETTTTATTTITAPSTTTTPSRPILASGVAEAIKSITATTHDKDEVSNDEKEQDDAGGSSISSTSTKVGVLLLNLGGPETSDDVEGFLYNLFADPDIIRLPAPLAPLQKYIARGISRTRSPKSKEAYESIGGGSPILKYSNEQASLLKQTLKERHLLDVINVYVGMRYWNPYTEEALDKIINDEINALIIIPLYPQFSISTSGSSLRVLQEEFAKKQHLYGPNKMYHTVVPYWYNRFGYIQSMVNLILKELNSFTKDELKMGDGKRHVLFSAHGVPRSYIEAGDPYQSQIQECVDQISKSLLLESSFKTSTTTTTSENNNNKAKDNDNNNNDTTTDIEIHLSYQSRVGPVEWLRPYTDDVLPLLGKANVKNLVVVPISFVSEHIETLEEIDIEYRELALEYGIVNWKRVPALNTNDIFINDLADLVVDAMSEPIQTVTEVCIANNCEVELPQSVVVVEEGEGGSSGMEIMESLQQQEREQQQQQQQQQEDEIQQQQQQQVAMSKTIKDNVNGGGGISVRSSENENENEENAENAKFAELINGRIAILGIAITILLELMSGKSLLQMFGTGTTGGGM